MGLLRLIAIFLLLSFTGCSLKTDYSVSSPDGRIVASLTFGKEEGKLMYTVQSGGEEIIALSTIGINTSRGDFQHGMKLTGSAKQKIDETYTLPQGKVSTYRNHANQQMLRFEKDGQELEVLFRVYNDGIAFGYSIPGREDIEIFEESSTITLSGEKITCWGQNHPNRYGYESALGPVDGERMSNPVLAHLEDRNHFALMGQAATYGQYIQPHFRRSGNTFKFSFPLDQEKLGPVRSALPFHSPWRMVVVSPNTPAKIVESYLAENLNPPADPAFLDSNGAVKSWVQPGRVMWDFIAGDRDKPRLWIDLTSEMGWEYFMADAGFANRWGGADSVREAVKYAKLKNVNILGWAHTREFNTRENAAEIMSRYAEWGLKGAKIDFFDHNTLSDNPRDWRDYEDTQESLRMRDWIFELGIENNFLLELHGNTVPTGERRRYPNLMTLEGVDGMERRAKPAANDLTIPYVRNVMGPVSYTVIHFERSPGSHAYQMAMPVIYEAGLMIYAEHGQKLLDWPGREMIKDIPSGWDETRFIDGMPASHIVLARRKNKDWYLAGMTDAPRTIHIPLTFIGEETICDALVFRDETHDTMHRETQTVRSNDTISFTMLERGGFVARFRPRQ